jgi:hypothetical protein
MCNPVVEQIVKNSTYAKLPFWCMHKLCARVPPCPVSSAGLEELPHLQKLFYLRIVGAFTCFISGTTTKKPAPHEISAPLVWVKDFSSVLEYSTVNVNLCGMLPRLLLISFVLKTRFMYNKKLNLNIFIIMLIFTKTQNRMELTKRCISKISFHIKQCVL